MNRSHHILLYTLLTTAVLFCAVSIVQRLPVHQTNGDVPPISILTPPEFCATQRENTPAEWRHNVANVILVSHGYNDRGYKIARRLFSPYHKSRHVTQEQQRAVAALLASTETVVATFDYTPRTHLAGTNIQRQLRDAINLVAETYPNAHIHLLGFSAGGTAALRLLGNPRMPHQAIASCIALAPFDSLASCIRHSIACHAHYLFALPELWPLMPFGSLSAAALAHWLLPLCTLQQKRPCSLRTPLPRNTPLLIMTNDADTWVPNEPWLGLCCNGTGHVTFSYPRIHSAYERDTHVAVITHPTTLKNVYAFYLTHLYRPATG